MPQITLALPKFASLLIIGIAALILSTSGYAGEAEELFNRRLLPIFRSQEPSSCVQCHLASVDLKNYILPSSDATFVSLRDQGLIDLDAPAASKILQLIKMGEQDLDEGARLIHADMRAAELKAFSQWVEACCEDSRLRSLPKAQVLAKPAVPNGVIRHARKNRIVDSFVRNVWSQRMRCFPCHTPNEIDPANPKHQAAIKTRKKFEDIYDQAMLERLAIFRDTPEATLAYLVESSKSTPAGRLPLINLAEPENSLLVLKPMSKLPKKREDGTLEDPSYVFPLSHMGGLKLHKNDQSYKSFVGWIRDYAQVVAGGYKTVEQLPADNWYPTQLVLRLKNAPDEWPVGAVAQLFLYSWDDEKEAWVDEPIGFTQGSVTPRKMVNGALFLFGDRHVSSDQDPSEVKLPRGRYLAKVYFDSRDRISEDPTLLLSQSDYFGEFEIANAKWRPGFRFAQVIDAGKLVPSQ